MEGTSQGLKGQITVYIACCGMMAESYPDVLIDRFFKPGQERIAELRSYWEIQTFNGHTLPTFGRPFFLDSGAFTAYSRGKIITVEEYGGYLQRYHEQIDIYANLDAIPRSPSERDRQIGAEQTLANQQALEAMGLKPIPVFHMGEPWEYLVEYLKNYEYICLGGLVSVGKLDSYLDEVWGRFLVDGAGRPTHKIHGFGLTSLRHLSSYPWWSVDSSTWLVHAKYGIITVPPKKVGGWDFLSPPTLLGVGAQSSLKMEEGRHYSSLTEHHQSLIREYLDSIGTKIENLQGHPSDRFVVNLEYWVQAQEAIRKLRPRFRPQQESLL